MWNTRDLVRAAPRASTTDQRALKVAFSWLACHGGRHVRLSVKDVREIAFRLVDAGIEPSYQAVRTVNGGHGSDRVIVAGVSDFFARMQYGTRWDRLNIRRRSQVPVRRVARVTLDRHVGRIDGTEFTRGPRRGIDELWDP